MSTRRKRSNPLQSDDFTTPEDLEQETFPEVGPQEELEGGPLLKETEEPQEPPTSTATEELTGSLPPEEPQEPPTDTATEELTESPLPEEPPSSAIKVVTETPEPATPFKSRSRPLKPLRQRNIPRFSSFTK